MAYFSPEESFERLKQHTTDVVKGYFPVEGDKHLLRVKNVWVDDDKHIDDIRSQKESRVSGRTWSVPVKAQLELVDKKTGKVLDSQEQTILQLPKVTRRHSFIVDGNEWQIANQFRLKSGVYTRIKENGELESQWNLEKGKGFRMGFDPKTKRLHLKYGEARVPLYPVLKVLGVDDDEIERRWGKDVLNENMKGGEEKTLRQLYKSMVGEGAPADIAQIRSAIVDQFGKTKLRADSTQITLGTPFDKVSGSALLHGAEKILKVSRQEVDPDDRDGLQFKDFYSAEDLLRERLEKDSRRDISRRLTNKIDKTTKLREMIHPDIFGRAVKSFFTNTAISERPTQTNPLNFLGGARKTTIGGEHGIDDPHKITLEAKMIHPSHLGFLDPVQTPESERIGTVLQMASGSKKVGKEIHTAVYNIKTGKMDWIDPAKALTSNVAFPDQYRWEGSKPSPLHKDIKIVDREGKMTVVSPEKVDYVLRSSKGMFDLSANLIPFLQNDQGNRTMVAAKQLEQAVPLVHREAPLVQTKGVASGTFENALGRFNSHEAPVAGTVYSVGPDHIIIRDASGKKHEVQLYDHFPLNDNKALIHSTALVAKGDIVKAGQLIADTNFTREGKLALGTNLRVAYIPYKGYNYDDGIVISDSAAQKLTSEHMHREGHKVDDSTILSKAKFLAHTAGQVSKKQADKLDEHAVIKIGSTVETGDVLLGILKKEEHTQEQRALSVFSKKTLNPVSARPIHWDKEYPGVVTGVVRSGKETTVYIKAQTPAQVGDKLAGRHGNKGVITKIMPDHEMPHTEDGTPMEILLNPTGVPTRINLGQVLETVAGKLAAKVGRTYVVDNFDPEVPDYTKHLTEELKKHGVSDKENLIDPTSNKKLGEALTGNQHILKLHHTAEKGIVARSRGGYDVNMTPKHGGSTGGQTLDISGMYALLAHGARENIREAQTIKCFLRRTMVDTEDGPVPISVIVNNRLPVRVRSKNPKTGKLEYKSILNYWKRKIDEPVLKVAHMARAEGGTFKRFVTKCTYKHQFYTPEGKVHAKDLEGRKLLSPGLVPSQLQRELLVGSLLGDGCLTKSHHQFPTFQERHCEAQKEYLAMKAGMLADFGQRDVRDYNAGTEGFNVGQGMCEWGTFAQPAFEEFYDGFYREGSKHVPGNIKDLLTSFVLAVWFMDDGSFSACERTRAVRLATGNFDETDRNLLIEAIDAKFGVRFYETKSRNDPAHSAQEFQYGLQIASKEAVDRFLDIVAPFVHPSLAYKVEDRPCGEALEVVWNACIAEEALVEVPVLSVEDYDEIESNDGAFLYNLEVEGNHNYFADGVLVGNSDMNDDFWTALQAGESIPAPRTPFVYKKFEGYLKAIGVNVVKDGNAMHLVPLTDKQTLAMSNGELTAPDKLIRAKDLKPEAGGLFDPKITGTLFPDGKLGDRWSHFTLAQRMPNPVFEKPIQVLLGLKGEDLDKVIAGEKHIDGKTGPSAVVDGLSKLNVKTALEHLEQSLPKMRKSDLSDATKKVKFLRALDRHGLTPIEAYTMQNLPVLPPAMRPISVMQNGDLNEADQNGLYKNIAETNHQIKTFDEKLMPPEEKHDLHAELYDGLKALMLTGSTNRGRHRRGILDIIARGKNEGPKAGFFQDKVIGRRQDLSMRGVIVPEPSLGLDEAAIPRKAAEEIYKPFVVRRLVRAGYTPLQAQMEVRKGTASAHSALEAEVKDRPLLLKRDPVLHKFGVQAFKPVLTTGNAIKIHPLATAGYNADFDGDKMSAYVPVSQKAVQEAFDMLPSKNLFNPSDGKLIFAPSQESMLGLYKLSIFGKQTNHHFKTAADAALAVKEGKISLHDVVHVDDPHALVKVAESGHKPAPVKTTVGRLMLQHGVPPGTLPSDFLTDGKYELTKKNLHVLLTGVAKRHDGDTFARTADFMKNVGNEYATGYSFGLSDLRAHSKERDEILHVAQEQEKKIRAGKHSQKETDDQIVALYTRAGDQIEKKIKPVIDASTNKMYDWVRSGARGNWDQYKQMVIGPMLVVDSSGRKIPAPITKSYSEGLDTGSYWASLYGARMGTIGRVEGTEIPGSQTKQMIQTSLNQLVTADDCGTTKGLAFHVDDNTILDRFTATDIHLGDRGGKDKGSIPAGSLITPEVVARLKNNKVKDVPVRTPLKCQEHSGICAKCFGLSERGHLHPKGTNIGVMAVHALGEPMTQMAMNAFHEGGVAGARGSMAVDKITRLRQLTELPEKLPEAATLSRISGKVDRVEEDKSTGGWHVHVNGEKHYVSGRQALSVKTGDELKKGDPLSDGPINPRELLPLTNLSAVQRYITDELQKVYGSTSNLHRRNTEVFVRALTNLSLVTDASDHPEFMKGDRVATSQIQAYNAKVPAGKKPVAYMPVLKGTNNLPLDINSDWLARLQHRDLSRTIQDAAAEGWVSNIHGTHPIPGMAWGAEFGRGTPDAPWLY
jgi:DNA-directed RNA polymerase subunit beta'